MSVNLDKEKFDRAGFLVLDKLFAQDEVEQIIACIERCESDVLANTKTKDLFAIREVIKKIPALKNYIFTEKVIDLLSDLFESDYFLSKSIYFDKPKVSNWFVAYHQDLSISVDHKEVLPDYKNWTTKKDVFGVQPPVEILENTITLRIHLDDTDKSNGALKVIPSSHKAGVVRSNSDNWKVAEEVVCEVNKGGGMLMKPLTFHASDRTVNAKRRRVIHLEFCDQNLAGSLKWAEYESVC